MTGRGGIYELNRNDTGLELRFSSSMALIDDACAAASNFLKSHPSFSSHLFAVNLVLREGLTNAVRHGNKNMPSKMVDLKLAIVSQAMLKVCIEDQGPGFDWKKKAGIQVSDDTDHGRGMTIMATYFDRYRYNEKGNILYLEKKGDVPPSPESRR